MGNKFRGALKSKTIWFSLLLALATWLNNHVDLFQSMFPEGAKDLVGYGIAFIVALLRFVTNKPLEEK